MNRRDALVGVAAAVAAAGSSAALERPAAPAGLSTLQQFVKLRGALDERLVTGFVIGRFDGVVGDVVTPLFGVLSAVFSRYRSTSAGYVVVSYEQAYYTDLDSGRVVERMKNPYTGDTVEVPVYNPLARRRAPIPQSRGTVRERSGTAVRAGSRTRRRRCRVRRGSRGLRGGHGRRARIPLSGSHGATG
jgi:hypothetical protein